VSDFHLVRGFEDVWRPPVRPAWRTPETVLGGGSREAVRARLARMVRRAAEVMVKVTGRTRDADHLRAHLDYISRKGGLELAGRDEAVLVGRGAVRDLAADWAAAAALDSRRRANTPLSLSIVLSMPAGTDALALRDAAREFAEATFGDRFDYAFALHTDTPRPHVHLAVRALGDDGQRLNPKKGDLEAWRQVFAQALRDRGIEAEATPRRARGITRKGERGAVRRIAQRHAAGRSPMPRVRQAAYRQAARAAFEGGRVFKPWEEALAARQARIRALYLAQARLLQASAAREDQALGARVAAFVREMPAPDSQRLALARDLRAANEKARLRLRPPPGRERG
jgi:type IV secretory pathway VirD2 relaxase